jgi:hypothetical protein
VVDDNFPKTCGYTRHGDLVPGREVKGLVRSRAANHRAHEASRHHHDRRPADRLRLLPLETWAMGYIPF